MSPKSQKSSPRSSIYTKHEISQDNIIDDFSLDGPASPSRRMTRNVFSDFARKRGFSESSTKNEGADVSISKEKNAKHSGSRQSTSCIVLGEEAASSSSSPDKRRESLRSGGRHVSESSTGAVKQKKTGASIVGVGTGDFHKGISLLRDRIVPPPPFNVSTSSNTAAGVSSKDSTTSSQNTPSHPSETSSSLVYCNG